MRYKLAMTLMALSIVLRGSADMPMLRWLDDDKARGNLTNVAMKILREDKSLSYAAPTNSLFPANATTDNILVHGDNLEALKALLPFYAGKVKCIYIDPPYNTGNMFPNYDDNLEHSIWLNIMYSRLKLLKEFLAPDGNFFMQLDDNELDYAKVICDEIFGRKNFVNRITIDVRAPSAFSTVNPGVFKCSEYILWYGANKSSVPMIEERVVRDVDFAYKLWLKNPDDMHTQWEFCSIVEAYADMKKAKNAKKEKREEKVVNPITEYNQFQRFIIENAKRVYRTASISDSGAGQEVVELKKESLANPDVMYFMHRDKYDDVYIKNGEQYISYEKNIRLVDGKKQATRQITNIWNDIPWEGIAKEGGVVLKKSKKPERLIQRVISMVTKPGDYVMDSFLGSGTTAAVAHKTGRRWIGIEMGDHARTMCQVRLKAVCDGEQSGISKDIKWKGGGGFRFYELGEAILQKDGTLTEDIPFETMAAHVWFTETKRPYDRPKKKTTVLGVTDDGVAYALLYNGILGDRSVGGGNVLTKKTLKVIEDDLRSVTKASGIDKVEKSVVYAEACRLSEDTLTAANVVFRQTPYDLVVRK